MIEEEVSGLVEANLDVVTMVVRKLLPMLRFCRVEFEDAVQEGSIALLESAKGWNRQSSFRTYAYTVVKFHLFHLCGAIGAKKRRPKRLWSLNANDSPRYTKSQVDLLIFQEILSKVHVSNREIVRYWLEGYILSEIGSKCGITKQAACSRLNSELSRLRKLMGEE